MSNNVLSQIPGQHIARAAQTLPDPASAPDERHYVEVRFDSQRAVITFKPVFYKSSRWFWTAESAVFIELTDDEIKDITREAFRPLRCIVEILPDRQIRFQVIKQRHPTPVYTEPGIPIEVVREDDNLRELLGSVRGVLHQRGYRLNPWPLPR
jgi:hypothetical protein